MYITDEALFSSTTSCLYIKALNSFAIPNNTYTFVSSEYNINQFVYFINLIYPYQSRTGSGPLQGT